MVLASVVDERFLAHRLRATSLASMTGAVLAGGILLYRFYAHHIWSWDLFAVIAAMAAVKVGAMIWYRLRD